MKSRQLFFVLISFLSCVSFGENSKCHSRLVDFNKKHLACLKQHIATMNIGKNLSQLRALKKNCQDCKDPFPYASNFLDLADRRYLAIGIMEQPFGGFSILVLFENEPYAHQLWLYPIDAWEFQLRDVEIQKFSKKFTQQMLKDAKEPRFAKYWTIPHPTLRAAKLQPTALIVRNDQPRNLHAESIQQYHRQ